MKRIKKIILPLFTLLFLPLALTAQNRYEEVIPYSIMTGHVVVTVLVKGAPYNFAIDLKGESVTRIYEHYAGEMGVNAGDGIVEKIGLGDNLFFRTFTVQMLDDIGEAGDIAGFLGRDFFRNTVLTIDGADKTIAISAPYKPSYVRLANRADIGTGNTYPVIGGDKKIPVVLDLAQEAVLVLTGEDAGTALNPVSFIAAEIPDDRILREPDSDGISILGRGILDYGVISLDFAKGKVYFEPLSTLDKPAAVTVSEETIKKEGNIIHLTRKSFLELVADFRNEDEWKYKGELPAVVDFWAPWCGPCKRLAPILDELSREYEGRVLFYKVDTDEEPEIANHFKISSIPLLMYIPLEGPPRMVSGAFPLESVKSMIEQILIGGQENTTEEY